MKVAIHQPNFLPWIGYFNKIKSVDLFVFFDDVQFERGKTYTSRTKIIIQGQECWLTIPVINKSSLVLIKDIEVASDFTWKTKHLKTITNNYSKTRYFDEVFPIINKVYSNKSLYLIDYNVPLITDISAYLGVLTKFRFSSEVLGADSNGSDRILNILKSLNASVYLSGSGEGSKRYINESEFENKGVVLKWQHYEAKPYLQSGLKSFIGNLSIIDLLFNCGKEAVKLI